MEKRRNVACAAGRLPLWCSASLRGCSPYRGGTVRLRAAGGQEIALEKRGNVACAAGALRLAKSRRYAAVARMHARCGS